MGELGGIGKLTSEERRRRGLGGGDGGAGVSYAYRGIDQIAAAVQPLLAKHEVVIVPTSTESKVVDITVNQKPWTDTSIRIEWTIAGPNDTYLKACSEGQGRDNSDKGINKAFTSAYKNLLLRLLAIGDPDEDADNQRHEAEVPPAVYPPKVEKLWARITEAKGTPYAAAIRKAADENNMEITRPAFTEDEHWYDLVTSILNDPSIGAADDTKETTNG
jgi:hypothetical protein